MKLSNDVLNFIFSQMDTICKSCAMIIKDAQGYSETTTAFEVFGLDFLIGADYNVYLLEINDKVGYDSALNKYGKYNSDYHTPEYTKFSNDYFNWVYKNGIKDIMSEKDKFID